MKQLLQKYAAYHLWANDKMREALTLLSSEQQHQEIESSFNSLYKTVFHVWGAQFLWWTRMRGDSNITKLEDRFQGSMGTLMVAWREMDVQWLAFVNDLSEERLGEILHYKNTKGDPFAEEIHLILHHIFNHGTYHRGQMVTMLRQAGAERIPPTDFIHWVRTTI